LQRYGITCTNCSLESYMDSSTRSSSEKFDCVILSHMLEHFVQPEKALEMIGGILKPDGIIYILVPNLYGFTRPYSQFTTPHAFYFSKTSLGMLLNNCGFMAHGHFETPSDEIALVARRADSRQSAIEADTTEYERVSSYLKKNGLDNMKILMRNALGRLVMMTLREDTYLTLRRRLRQIHILK